MVVEARMQFPVVSSVPILGVRPRGEAKERRKGQRESTDLQATSLDPMCSSLSQTALRWRSITAVILTAAAAAQEKRTAIWITMKQQRRYPHTHQSRKSEDGDGASVGGEIWHHKTDPPLRTMSWAFCAGGLPPDDPGSMARHEMTATIKMPPGSTSRHPEASRKS